MNDDANGAMWRIDPGTHGGRITRLIASSSGDFFITVGTDKRIRMWSPGLERLRTFIGDIGPGRDGTILAAALRPDDRRLVTAVHRPGGATSSGSSTVVRVFDTGTAEIVWAARWPSSIHDLAYTEDGRALIVATSDRLEVYPAFGHDLGEGSAERSGLGPAPEPSSRIGLYVEPSSIATRGSHDEGRVWVTGPCAVRPQAFRLSAERLTEVEFGGPDDARVVRPTSLAASGRHVAVTGETGQLGIYDHDGRLVVLADGAGGGSPTTPAFNDDGSRLIVGSHGGDRSLVTVHDAAHGYAVVGRRTHEADAVAVGFLGRDIAVSAGGSRPSILTWLADTMSDAPGGDLAFGDTVVDGAGQVIDAVGIRGLQVAFGHPELAVAEAGAEVAADEAELAFRFDLEALTLLTSDPIAPDLLAFDEFSRAIHAAGDRRLVAESGPFLLLDPEGHALTGHGQYVFDPAVSFGFMPGGSVAIGGRSGAVRVVRPDPDGLLRGRRLTDHTGPVLDLAVDEGWLVTGGVDQVLRLWSVNEAEAGTGSPDDEDAALKPALNLFVAADLEWVIWSGSGYFASSPDGDRYLTHHHNRGEAERASTLTCDRFARSLDRPDVIRRILVDGSEGAALERLDLRADDAMTTGMPPSIRLRPEAGGSGDDGHVVLRFEVAAAAGHPTTRVWVLHNGLPAWQDQPRADHDGHYDVRLRLRPRRNRFRILAENDVARATAVELRVTDQSEAVEVAAGAAPSGADSAAGPVVAAASSEPMVAAAYAEPGVAAMSDVEAMSDVGAEADPGAPVDRRVSEVPAVVLGEGRILVEEPRFGPPVVAGSVPWPGAVADGGRTGPAPEPAQAVAAMASPAAAPADVGPAPEPKAEIVGLDLVIHLTAPEDDAVEIVATRNGDVVVQAGFDQGAGSRLTTTLPLVPGPNTVRVTSSGEAGDEDLMLVEIDLGAQPSGVGAGLADPPPVTHVVEPGDTLRAIATHHYGQAALYTVIFEANRPPLQDPNRILVGQVLEIPNIPGLSPPIAEPIDRPDTIDPAPVTQPEGEEPGGTVEQPPLPVDLWQPAGGDVVGARRGSKGQDTTPQPEDPPRAWTAVDPNLYLLSIGVSDLEHETRTLGDLQFAADDALALARRFSESKGALFGDVRKWVLTDGTATKATIQQGVADLVAAVEARALDKEQRLHDATDLAVVFFSGHGVTVQGASGAANEFYLVPNDFEPDRPAETGVAVAEVGQALSSLPVELLILIDSCRSGASTNTFVQHIHPDELVKRLRAISERAQFILSATSHKEDAWEHTLYVPYTRSAGARRLVGHGFFTHAIMKTLDEADGRLSVSELLARVQRQFRRWSLLEGWEQLRQRPKFRVYGDADHVEIYQRQRKVTP